MKDKSCLVPCDGLYADVADNSLKQNVMKGKNPLNSYYSTFVDNYYHLGFQTITDELGKANKRFDVLQQMFPDLSADEESKSVDSLTRIYHNYKREYVKHLSFNPGTENLSKYLLMTLLGYLFSATAIEHSPLEAVYIFFDTATYDEIERDEKVMLESWRQIICDFFKSPLDWTFSKGDNRSPVGFDRRHHGSSHRLLHPQWGRDRLLPAQVSFKFL